MSMSKKASPNLAPITYAFEARVNITKQNCDILTSSEYNKKKSMIKFLSFFLECHGECHYLHPPYIE